MARKARSVPHLHDRGGRYFARLAVPEKLRPIVGKRELLEPLGGDRALALVKLHGAVDRFHKTLADAHRGIPPALPSVSIRQAVHDRYAAELRTDEARDLRGEPGRADSKGFNALFAEAYRRNLRKVARGHIGDDELAEGFVEATIGWAVEEACRGRQQPAPRSKEYLDLAAALAQAQLEALERSGERDAGDWSGKPTFKLLREPPHDPAPVAPVTITGLLDTYVAMLARLGRGAESAKRWRPCIRRLVAFLKHDDARRVTKADLLRWLDHLRDEGLSERTIRDNDLGCVKAIFTYAAEQELLPASPAANVKVRLARAEQIREKGLTSQEARAILAASRAYQPKPSTNPATREGEQLTAAKRWAPMLCAYTGARIAEITQLRKEDVREQDGVAFLRLTPEAGSIKTGLFRDVPLHGAIVEAGFLAFVEASLAGPLFYRVDPSRKGTTHPSKTVSGRISQWLRTLDIVADGVDPNHGWRHRFKTVGREAGIEGRVLDAIQGHAARTAGDAYGDVTLKTKATQLARLPRIL